MSGSRRWFLGVAGAVFVVLSGAVVPAYGETLQQCMNHVDQFGQPPTCTEINGSWVPSSSDGTSGGGFGVFGVLFVFALLIGIGFTIWKVLTARKLATQAGMDPGLATTMTLLTQDGLDATYVAANLRQPPTTPAATETPVRGPATAAERLSELQALLGRGLVSRAEYDERRKAILDSL